jgi:protein-tyrosine phosphatase
MTDRSPRTSILFVCTGNICRSPLAEGIFRQHAAQRGVADLFFVDSAGTGDWHVGEAPDERVQRLAARQGVKLHRTARQVAPDDFARFHHIFCMDEDNREELLEMGAPADKVRLLLECDPGAPMLEVPDPYFGGDDGFALVWRLIDSACDAVLDELMAQRASHGEGTT